MDTIKKVFVLAGGNDQIELIKGIRKRFPGVEVILIDMNPNVRAKDFADKMLVISTMDFDKVLEAAKRENIDLILSACGDQPLRTMAYISEKLNLPCYLSYQQSLNLTNKTLMKDLMLQGNIPTSKYKKFEINSDISLEGLQFPLVLKPSDNNGSKGVIKVNDEAEFMQALKESKKYTLSGELLIEEFKNGEEYSIEGFIKDGEPVLVFASKNHKIKDRNTFTICSNEYIPFLSDILKAKILDIVKRIGITFEIDNVPLLIQLIYDGKNINVIEFSARTGGGSKLFFIRKMTGVDVIDNLIDITLGQSPNIKPHFLRQNAIIKYVYAEPGIFSSIKGIEKLEKENVITDTFFYKSFESRINSSNYSSDRPLGFLIMADSKEELDCKILHINENVKILDENGNDIMRHDVFIS